MSERRDNGRQRRETRIKEWETLERVTNRTEEIGRQSLGIEVVIDQPLLDNGRRGFKRVGTKLSMGDRFLRLNTKALVALLDILTEERSALLAAIDKVHADNEELEKERRNQRGNSRGRGGGRGRNSLREESEAMRGKTGGGLSRFTKTSKRERKREKHRKRERENNDA